MSDLETPTSPAETDAPTGVTQPAESTGDSRFSSAFARLAKKEQQLRKERESFLSERDKYKTEQTEYQTLKEKMAAFEQAKANARLNPKAVLDEMGLSFEELQEFFLNGAQPSANLLVDQLRKELEQTKSEFQKRLEEKELETQRIQTERQEREFKYQLSQQIQASDADFLKAHDAPEETLYQLMKGWYDKHGEVLDASEAIKLIESELEAEFDRKYGKLDKVTSKFKAHLGTPMQEPQYRQRTLPTSAPFGSTQPQQKLSDAERIQAAAAMMRGK